VATAPQAAAQVGGDVSFGYSFLKLLGEETIPLGWNFSAAGKVNDHVSIVGDIGGHYYTDGHTWSAHTFGGGVRLFGKRTARVVPFGQATFGTLVWHEKEGTDFVWAFQPGFGIDVPFRPGGPAFRTQVDVPLYFRGDSVWGVRWTVGVAIPIK